MLNSDSSFYEGMWKNGLMSGLGKAKFANGSYYDGQWENNQMSGLGIAYLSNLYGASLHGVWTNGFPNGGFKIEFENKYWVEINFKNGQPWGLTKACNVDEFLGISSSLTLSAKPTEKQLIEMKKWEERAALKTNEPKECAIPTQKKLHV